MIYTVTDGGLMNWLRSASLTDTVLVVRRQVIPVQTQTPEGAHAVDALAVPAHLTGVNAALVDI